MGAVQFSGYYVFTPRLDGARGLMTLVKATIPCFLIANPLYCGDGMESLAVEIHLPPSNCPMYTANHYVTA